MKLSKEQQQNLLALQDADLQASRLRHRLEADPLHQKLSELAGRSADLRRSMLTQQADLGALARKMTALEDEIQKVEDRRALQQGRLDSGKIMPRDMRAVEHEISKIVERKEQLEMELMELEDEQEKRVRFLANTENSEKALVADEAKTREQMADGMKEPADQLEFAEQTASGLREGLPASVLEEYDHLRSRMGALVVLRFEDGALRDAPCELPLDERAQLLRAPEDELFESEDTGYLIVRV